MSAEQVVATRPNLQVEKTTPPVFTIIEPATTRQRCKGSSLDSIGLGSGDTNLYSYVGNSPTNFTDPSGNIPQALGALCLKGAISGAAAYTIINVLAGRKVTLWGFLASAGGGCVAGIGIGLGLRALMALRHARAARPPLWTSTNTKSALKNVLGHWKKHKGEFPEV